MGAKDIGSSPDMLIGRLIQLVRMLPLQGCCQEFNSLNAFWKDARMVIGQFAKLLQFFCLWVRTPLLPLCSIFISLNLSSNFSILDFLLFVLFRFSSSSYLTFSSFLLSSSFTLNEIGRASCRERV